MLPELTDAEALRYNRQIILRGFDFDGQEKLKAARVLIVGLGGLGCAAAPYLVAAGVGHLTLVDFDTVSLSNLQRQILHRDARIGMTKVESARLELSAINPHAQIETVDAQLDDDQMAAQITACDLVLDCTDNVATRNLLNRLCHAQRKPLVSGAAIRMEGQLSVFTYQPEEPCYRCLSRLFGDNALTCVEAGVMAPLVGTIGTLQAMEAIKLLTQYGQPLTGKLLMFDAMTMQFREMKLPKDPQCDVCGGE
ncbi:MAG: molybdopterin-synthase adenylyltransferase MoeB [Serratia liquefaciens]|jgi:molybdopterin-synthase adenylyltransferase|uniref:molybdopterin-synthase adenylyltransferase MoeB n=1 Tax=Serratia liquefaciens TaxID=614 RepID=UPI00217C5BA8|nr:molybdopterin-synthase adenylyltransferase MoeB [Serratia liquefaciens]MCH4195667.1 molybdopterin-synthase adenylyltransferase MoeB [Serratia liquefaciens]MCH4234132.1 molybdopterin-synthase adenylyltransferase MoeB [Serratia liquefaciens]MCI1216569.1 molybdopterin-synthase adenylyltransferase MoeB [Serratia liquefaciens]MCI1237404.1 molybdopterin-synthase adenylyltransferase MoeB [Serratia liquefaciens]MCI1252950.1 molybdopterin-synthase adenylyltransferase MoeB [Serratia liquefaciens]